MTDPQVRVGVAVLIERGGKLLMGRRKGSHGEGTWSFPGGHLDFGEDPETACIREAMEETGLEISNVQVYQPQPYAHTHFPETRKQYVTLYFTAECSADAEPQTMEPDKCESWGWFDKAALPTPLFEPIAQSGVTDTLKG